jgi:hypothetical protein
MDAKELRIGNFVNEEVLGDCEVYSVGRTTVQVYLKNVTCEGQLKYSTFTLSNHHVNRIPLTEEWLVKLNLNEFNELLGGTIEYQNGYVYIGGSDSVVNSQCFKVKIDFVHEYQNLYFALTNTELEIK